MTPGESSGGKRPFRVLIVDDEEDIQDSIGMILESKIEGVHVVMASDGQEALDMMASSVDEGKPVDLVMSDYKMPNMDGIEFLTQVKRDYPDVLRIMLTAYPDPKLAALAVRQAGVGLFIAKPFDPEYVGEVLKAFAPQ